MAKSPASANGQPAKAEQQSTNKSEAIRELLTANPKIGSKEIVATLGEKGMKVAPSLIYMVKSKLNKGQKRARRERANAAAGAAVRNPVEVIIRVKELARELGGYKSLKQLVDLLAE